MLFVIVSKVTSWIKIDSFHFRHIEYTAKLYKYNTLLYNSVFIRAKSRATTLYKWTCFHNTAHLNENVIPPTLSTALLEDTTLQLWNLSTKFEFSLYILEFILNLLNNIYFLAGCRNYFFISDMWITVLDDTINFLVPQHLWMHIKCFQLPILISISCSSIDMARQKQLIVERPWNVEKVKSYLCSHEPYHELKLLHRFVTDRTHFSGSFLESPHEKCFTLILQSLN